MQRKIFIEKLDHYNEKLSHARSKDDLDAIAKELGSTSYRCLYSVLANQGARVFHIPFFFKKEEVEEDSRINLE